MLMIAEPGRSEMAARTLSFDWKSTPLGPADSWPAALKSALSIALNSNQPMFIWWGPELIQFYNDAYRTTMGPERHPSALGQRGRDCWQEIWPIIGPQIESIMAGGPPTWHEDQLVPVTRHGARQDVWWTYGYSPIPDGSEVGGVLVVCRDVTEEHLQRCQLANANAELEAEVVRRRQESERLNVLFKQAPGFMCILRGPEHVFEFTNHAYMRLVGDRDLVGRAVRECLPDAAGQGFFEQLDEVYRSARPLIATEQELWLAPELGALRRQAFIDFIYQPIIEPDGMVSGIFVEGADVTDKVRSRQALRTSQQRLADGMRAARMTVWEWDVVSGDVEFSEGAAEILGAELQGLSRPWAWLAPAQAAVVATACDRAIQQRSEFHVVVRSDHGDGAPRWTDFRGNVVCDGAGRPRQVRGVTMDVSTRKQAEEELREADRMKNEFLAMLAHELRNPLAPISSAAQLLKRLSGGDSQVGLASEIIERQVSHMSGLVDDLLDASRMSRGLVDLDKQPVDLRELLDEAVEQVRPLLEKKQHRLESRDSGQPLMVFGDRKRLVQVFANVLNNAVKYTPAGGNIRIEKHCGSADIQLKICDDGIGMSAELLPRVFDLFTQADRAADRSQGGLGIGLSLVKGMVEMHGGEVGASSEGEGMGSTISICLPRHAEAVVQRDDAPQRVVREVSALHVLIVDDNRDAAATLGMCLEAAGHHPVVEHHSGQALERITRDCPDICLLDIGLPEIDGNELARRIRHQCQPDRQPTLIAITGYGDEVNRSASVEAGFDHYLVKPVPTQALLELLASLPAGRERGCLPGGPHSVSRST
jgi:signal transduction histidine kinase/ActR/RegA family two-component response regulator